MITPQTNFKVTIAIASTIVLFIIGATAGSVRAFGEKADKDELAPIRDEIVLLKKDRAVDFAMQQAMLKLLEKMDSRMERIENNQVWQIQESVKRWNGGTYQPPAAAPQPNPLNR